VTADALPEPYIGPLDPAAGEPRLVALGLNPGEADLVFQGPQGIFAQEMADAGGYASWAVSEPYLRDPWRSAHRPNRYHLALQTFAQRWTGDPHVRSRDVLVFELYPWHSTAVTSALRPAPEIVDRFVWQPVADLNESIVFGFGAPWQHVAIGLGLPEEHVDFSFSVAARRIRVFRLPSGQRLAVVWQPGYNGPPRRARCRPVAQRIVGVPPRIIRSRRFCNSC
jgi:hypothetical protein